MSSSATRRRARVLAVAAAAAVVPSTLIVLAGPALAAYPPVSPKCSSATATGAPTPGGAVTLSGVGFTPGQTVEVGGLGSAVVINKATTADSNGSVRVAEKLGAGRVQFTLSGTKLSASCGLIVVNAVVDTRTPTPTPAALTPSATSTARPATPNNALAFTGASNVGDAALLGGGLLLVGGAMIAFTRKTTGSHH